MQRTRRDLPPVTYRSSTDAREVDVLRLAFEAASANAAAVRDEVLAWAHGRCGTELPSAARAHGTARFGASGVTVDVVRTTREGVDAWSLRLVDGGVATEVSVADRDDAPPRVTVRLTSTAEDGDAATPDVARRLAHRFDLRAGGRSTSLTATRVADEDGVDALAEALTDPDRTWPVFVLSVPFGTDADGPSLDADALAAATCGSAATYVLPADMTWSLTRRFGKERSVHSGAVRTYMPGFDAADDVYAHPLVLPVRLVTPGMRHAEVARCVATAAAATLSDWRMGRDLVAHARLASVAPPVPVPDAAPKVRAPVTFGLPRALARLAPPAPVAMPTDATDDVVVTVDAPSARTVGTDAASALAAASRDLDAARAEVEELRAARDALRGEASAARAEAEAARAAAAASAAHVEHLREALRNRGAAEWEVATPPAAWDAVADWCDEHLRGMVTVSPLARRGLKAALFEDISLLHRCLLWLAGRAGGDGNGTLLDAVVEAGVRVRPCGGDAFDFQDGTGRRLTADWHVKAGGNTRDPRRCLRIYFAWDAATRTFAVADMPGHRDSLVS